MPAFLSHNYLSSQLNNVFMADSIFGILFGKLSFYNIFPLFLNSCTGLLCLKNWLHRLPRIRYIQKFMIISSQTKYKRCGVRIMYWRTRCIFCAWRSRLLKNYTEFVTVPSTHLSITLLTIFWNTWKYLEPFLSWALLRSKIKISISINRTEKLPWDTVPGLMKLWEGYIFTLPHFYTIPTSNCDFPTNEMKLYTIRALSKNSTSSSWWVHVTLSELFRILHYLLPLFISSTVLSNF